MLSFRINWLIHLELTWETIALIIWTSVSKVISLLFNMLSRLVLVFLPRSKWLLISWLQSPSSGVQERKIYHCFQFFPFSLPCSDMTGCHDLSVLKDEFQQLFHSSFTFMRRLFSSSSLSSINGRKSLFILCISEVLVAISIIFNFTRVLFILKKRFYFHWSFLVFLILFLFIFCSYYYYLPSIQFGLSVILFFKIKLLKIAYLRFFFLM